MKLAVITDEISQDFAHALDVMLEYGVTGAELRGLWDTNISDLTDAQIERAVDELKQRDMHVVCLATPFYKCDLGGGPTGVDGPLHLATPRPLADQMKILNRCIEAANRFETPFLRIFSFWRKSAYLPEVEARIVDALSEPVETARGAGVTLLLENEHACYIGTGAEAARVAAEINSPALRIAWDPGNAFHAGEKPFPDGYEAVKPWTEHIHIKDARIVQTEMHGPQPDWCIIGEGEIDYAGHFMALRRDGYQGYLSLETHFKPKRGTAPDGRGSAEDGSRACLAALTRMLNQN